MKPLLSLALLGAAMLLATPSQADDIGLPDWAAPAEPVATAPASIVAPPTPQEAPAAVPLDGGLALLALAGAGYAARKLRSSSPDG